jgi:hypothetical protein
VAPSAAAVISTAPTFAPNSKLPEVNSSNERLSWKKMISLKPSAPAWNPMLSWFIFVSPAYLPCS